MTEEITDQELANRLRDAWKTVKEDAVALGWRGYKIHVSLLDYKTWNHYELSHFQTMSDVRIGKSTTEVVSL